MASVLGGGKKWLRRRSKEQYLGGWLSSECEFVEVDCSCQYSDEENITLVMPSAWDDMTNIYPGDSYFEPNAM